jgi:hypothetical protein
MKKGGVCIFVQNTMKFDTINLDKFACDQDIEVCAIQLNTSNTKLCILAVYRSPLGNFTTFLNKFEIILQKLFNKNSEFIVCGDFNIDYAIYNSKRNQLDSLLNTFNLSSVVTFPTRININSCSIIDNFFIDISQINKFYKLPIIIGLSDHEGQLLTIYLPYKVENPQQTHFVRKINKDALTDFKFKLSFETWESVFGGKDVNKIFNTFLNTFLRIYYSSFPLIQVNPITRFNTWITSGIIRSCQRKRELYRVYTKELCSFKNS